VVLEIKTDRLKDKIIKGVWVNSNDPGWPILKFQITATVKTLLKISPGERAFLRIKQGESWFKEFKITSPDDIPFKIQEVKSSSKYFTATVDHNEQPGYTIKLSVSPDIPIGNVRARVEIFSDIFQGVSEEILITGKVEGPIIFSPGQISFSPDTTISEGLFSRTVHLIETKGNGFKVEDVKTNNKNIIWNIITLKKGRSYILVLVWTGGEIKRRIEGEIVISTNNVDMPRIRIPWWAFPNSRGK